MMLRLVSPRQLPCAVVMRAVSSSSPSVASLEAEAQKQQRSPMELLLETPARSKKVGLVGIGKIGAGLLQCLAQTAKLNVIAVDKTREIIDARLDYLDSHLKRYVSNKLITETEREEIKSRVETSTELADLKEMDYVFEAVSEEPQLKQRTMLALEEIVDSRTPIASTSSNIPITLIASTANRPDRIIGTHFIHPVAIVKSVEVVPGMLTHAEVAAETHRLIHLMGKRSSLVRDVPGMVNNRLTMVFINEAIHALEQRVSSRDEIDIIMRESLMMQKGPLALADLMGLDHVLFTLQALYNETKDVKFRPPHLLKQHVRAGLLGFKTGQGFYIYDAVD
eukprot:gnl/Spiro4/11824_TR6243_c0_g1_i1.p1 gnl/Spiro4/11824_TR6243_c0_g1~~gnl/Spiro4/11824_TR6243_c0_g1_i1.p1  ORF type:complete len:346 (-),score=118.41 gnl/Spiro4/11824_TR6243_c0_g1_i1:38-1048(-)